jgi:surface antigen
MKKWKGMFIVYGMVALLLTGVEIIYGYDDHDYPYEEVSCLSCPQSDKYSFCQNHCTSYVAYMLNLHGVPFHNYNYLVNVMNDGWHHAGHWAEIALRIGIPADETPLPGDVAYWELNWTGDPKNTGDDYGHVAWVERVIFDENINPVSIEITEYNFDVKCGFSHRTIPISEPSGFIHILAYNEGVTSLFYMDNYEMSSLSSINQTEKEWEWILPKVNNYRCRTCSGNYRFVADVFYTDYGMGGGDAGDDGTSLNGPDGNIKEVKVSLDGVNYVRSLQVKPGQKLQGRVKVTNKGDETIDYFEVFFLSST